jgi:hypothetical protein
MRDHDRGAFHLAAIESLVGGALFERGEGTFLLNGASTHVSLLWRTTTGGSRFAGSTLAPTTTVARLAHLLPRWPHAGRRTEASKHPHRDEQRGKDGKMTLPRHSYTRVVDFDTRIIHTELFCVKADLSCFFPGG